jgi:N6-adenosine-specific RNA methylase IME4
MARPPLNPTGPMTAAERQARRRKRVGKSINRRRRTLYRIANESETKKAKRTRREEILATVAERTMAATAALTSMSMPLANLIVLDAPWPHTNYSVETGSDRSSDNHYAPMTWDELKAFGAKLPAAKDCMLMMWTPKALVVAASALLIRWGWDPLRTSEMIWLKTQANHPDKIAMGTGKRLRDQHESIIIAVRGAIPPALPMWPSTLIAPVGEHSEKPKALMEMIDRDYAPTLVRIEMFARPPFDRRRWWYWGDAVPGGLMFVP